MSHSFFHEAELDKYAAQKVTVKGTLQGETVTADTVSTIKSLSAMGLESRAARSETRWLRVRSRMIGRFVMTVATSSTLSDVSRSVVRLQVFTFIWMSVEAFVSLGTAWHTHSPALFAFGGDSLIELFSAAVVFWRFRFTLDEARAARIAGALLFVLAGLVVLNSILNLFGYREAQRSLLGMAILLAAAVVMPWLASRKRQLAAITSSAALKADAAESALCGYMAWIALAGLVINAIWGKSWADPVAAVALTPLILREGWEAVHSSRLRCGCS